MNFISGECRNQITLMPESIEDYVGEDNAVRLIDAYINSLNLAELDFAKHAPNDTGRPMYDPKDLLKLFVYGYMNKVRSSRRLETETKRNLEVIWLLNKLSPDHKTISRFRKDNTTALKNVFRDFVKLCMKLGLYGKELVAIDGSKFKAVNSKDRNFTDKKLRERIARIDSKIEEYLKELEDSDSAENVSASEKSSEEIAQIIIELAERKERYQSYSDELVQTGETQKSLTDPDSRLMMNNGKMDVCYNVQSSVDSKNKLIVEFEVTNNANDANLITPMVEKSKDILETDSLAAVVDAGYDSVQDIIASMENGNDIHVARTDFDICIPTTEEYHTEITSHQNGRCVYFADRNIVLCPMGNVLYPGFYKKTRGYAVFYNTKVCNRCGCECGKEKRGRRHQIPMLESEFSKIYNDSDLFVKQIRITPNSEIMRQRKSIVEHPFGTIKRNMDAGYCLTKGLKNVSGEFALAFLSYNLKRAINILGVRKLINCME
ncbi:MAG: IS1182 family transposase [Oscillospiraceae bacterium]|nr:IS1182 family transposase [Oscillospiraceae bacterium]